MTGAQRGLTGALLLALALHLLPVALAQPSTVAQAEALNACTSGYRSDEINAALTACTGQVARTCMDRAGDTTVDMVLCHSQEQSHWGNMLNRTYAGLRTRLDDDGQIALREMQLAWITARDATCGFYARAGEGSIQSLNAAQCMLQETARRALQLRAIAEAVSGPASAVSPATVRPWRNPDDPQ